MANFYLPNKASLWSDGLCVCFVSIMNGSPSVFQESEVVAGGDVFFCRKIGGVCGA